MATKKTSSPGSIAKPKAEPSRLQNLAARPPALDDSIDEQLVDHSGVFRVRAEIARAQTGHGDDSRRFPADTLTMPAQSDGRLGDEGPTIDESIEDRVIDDAASQAEKRHRLATLAARAKARKPR